MYLYVEPPKRLLSLGLLERGDRVGLVREETCRGPAVHLEGLLAIAVLVDRAGDDDEVPSVTRGRGVVPVELRRGDHLEGVEVEEVDVARLLTVHLLGVGPDLLLLASELDGAGARHLGAEADGHLFVSAIVDLRGVVLQVREELCGSDEAEHAVGVDHAVLAVDHVALQLLRHLGDAVAVLGLVEEEHRGVAVELDVALGREHHGAGLLVVRVERNADVRELVIRDLPQVLGGVLHGDEHRGPGELGEDGHVDELREAVGLRTVHRVELEPDLPLVVAPDGVTGEVIGAAVLGDGGLGILLEALGEEREGHQHFALSVV